MRPATMVAALFAPPLLSSPTRNSSADHVAGATYTGTHSGRGTVTLTVAADGSGVTSFEATNVRGDACTVGRASANSRTPLAIHNRAFRVPVPSGIVPVGTFL